NGFPKESASLARGVIGRVDSLLYVATSLSEGLPHFARHRVRDLFLAFGHNVADRAQHVSAGGSGSAAPLGESALRPIDGRIHLATVGERELANHITAVGRVPIVEIFAGFRRDPLSANEIVELFHFSPSLFDVRARRQLCSRESEYRSI